MLDNCCNVSKEDANLWLFDLKKTFFIEFKSDTNTSMVCFPNYFLIEFVFVVGVCLLWHYSSLYYFSDLNQVFILGLPCPVFLCNFFRASWPNLVKRKAVIRIV